VVIGELSEGNRRTLRLERVLAASVSMVEANQLSGTCRQLGQAEAYKLVYCV
jgi:hypothetical protein